MGHKTSKESELAHNPHGHQETTFSLKAVLLVSAGLAGLVLGTMVVVYLAADWKFPTFYRWDKPDASPFTENQLASVPPRPALQVDEFKSLQTDREKQQKHLATYGWNDKGRGVTHIPIERAMELVLPKLSSRELQP